MNEYQTKPLGPRILVYQFPQEETTKGGIIIEGQQYRDTAVGEVIAVSDGVYNGYLDKVIPLPFKVGDLVSYHKDAGVLDNQIQSDEGKTIIIKYLIETEIYAILTPKSNLVLPSQLN